MPPRASKKRGGAAAAKKKPAAPRATRASARNSKKPVEEVPIEDEQEEETNQVVVAQEHKEIPPHDFIQIDDDEEETNTESLVSSSINHEVIEKEEVLMNFENVEETKDVEEKNVEVVMEETVSTVVEETTVLVVEDTKVVGEETVEEKGPETVMVIEEKKVVNVEKNNMEIMDVNMDKKVVEVEEELEEDPEEIVEENPEKLVEANPEEIVEEDPEKLVEEDPEEIVEEDPEEVIEDGNKNKSGDGDDMVDDQQVAKQDMNEESAKAEAKDNVKGNDTSDANDSADMEGEDESGSDGEEFEEDEDPSAYMHAPLTDRTKQKEFEIFVGGLDKGAIEEDLTEVFEKFGEIKSVRIVKHPTSQKSKGFAFIRYATVEQAKKVLDELKDGAEVKGKRVGISPSQDSDTIYMGNICKTWKKDQVLEALKSLGIEQIEEIYLPDDPKNEEKTRGFALLEFSTHSDAMSAFQRLRKSDAVFGCDRSAKVAFAQSSIHPSEEALLQVKTVFVEGLTDLWNEERLREFGKQYGEVEKVQLSRDLGTTKRKDFGFISFTSRESAVACVEGFENLPIAEGDVKIKANLAKPQYKGKLGKQSAQDGYKVRMDGTVEAGSSKMKGPTKCSSEGKGKFHQNSKPQPRVGEHQGPVVPSRSDHHRREQPGRGGRRGGRKMEGGFHVQTSMKPRGNMHGRPGRGFPRSNSRFGNTTRQNYGYGGPPAPYVDPYTQRLPPSAPGYRGRASYGAHSGTKRHYSDMEPHPGYDEASTVKQSRGRYNYEPKRGAGGYGGQGSGPTPYAGPQPSSSYAPSNSVYPGYETGGRGYAYRGGPTSYAPLHLHLLPHPQPYARQPPHPHPLQMQLHPHQQPYPHPQQNSYPHPHPRPQQNLYPHPPPPQPGYY
ncbi:hypothetical protein MKX01_038302 [Papaver californicum]|nr:hypothetical protein MKX01_038302 [Papaver californicum]